MNTNLGSFLSVDQAIDVCPAIGATTHDGLRSERYTFVSSVQIIESMADCAWGLSRVMSPALRTVAAEFARHGMVFRPFDRDIVIEDPRSPGNYIVPEILVYNSADGTKSYIIRAGLFAFICSNGMVVSVINLGSFQRKHQDFEAADAYSIVQQYAASIPRISSKINAWQEVQLDEEDIRTFATVAAQLRWNDIDNLDPMNLALSRRSEDVGNDLWRVYNRVQEAILGGGFKRGKRQARPLTNIERIDYINNALWALAEDFADRS